MKVVIAGSRLFERNLANIKTLFDVVDEFEEQYGDITLEISGTAPGVDKLGELWAETNNISVARFPAKWDIHGKAAGPIRNKEMAEFCEAGIVLWDGKSSGTKHMIKCLDELNKPYLLKITQPIIYPVYRHQPKGIIKVVSEPLDRFMNDSAFE